MTVRRYVNNVLVSVEEPRRPQYKDGKKVLRYKHPIQFNATDEEYEKILAITVDEDMSQADAARALFRYGLQRYLYEKKALEEADKK